MKHLALIILLPVLLFINCNKTVNLSGDYCVCKINGQKWQGGCSGSFTNCLSAQWTDQKRTFTLSIQNNSPQEIGISLYDSTGLKSGIYILNRNFLSDCAWYRDYNKSYHYFYNTDSLHTGIISIKFDSSRARVSGSFSFKAVYDLNNETVIISEGQFSLPCLIE